MRHGPMREIATGAVVMWPRTSGSGQICASVRPMCRLLPSWRSVPALAFGRQQPGLRALYQWTASMDCLRSIAWGEDARV